jgi:hypothetical protein
MTERTSASGGGRLIVNLSVLAILIWICFVLAYCALVWVGALGQSQRDVVICWSLPGALALAGIAWPVHRGPAIGAVAAVCACAAALFFWALGEWLVPSCPDCRSEFGPATVFGLTMQGLAFLVVAGLVIVFAGALLSSAVHRVLMHRRD